MLRLVFLSDNSNNCIRISKACYLGIEEIMNKMIQLPERRHGNDSPAPKTEIMRPKQMM